jgi:hypothetical protein
MYSVASIKACECQRSVCISDIANIWRRICYYPTILDRAAAALKSDEAKALRDFNDTNNKLFHDRDLYISCFNTSDGKFTTFPGPGMVGI